MVSIIETMRFKYATIATIFIAISAIGCTGDGQGIKAIPSSNSQTRCVDTLDASIWATINFERPAGCY